MCLVVESMPDVYWDRSGLILVLTAMEPALSLMSQPCLVDVELQLEEPWVMVVETKVTMMNKRR
jgi:hypothetical protein